MTKGKFKEFAFMPMLLRISRLEGQRYFEEHFGKLDIQILQYYFILNSRLSGTR